MCYYIEAVARQQNARVVELVDSLDSGSSVHSGRAGSTPASRTMKETSFVYQDKRGFSCILGEKRVQIRNKGIVVEFKCGVAIEQEYVK